MIDLVCLARGECNVRLCAFIQWYNGQQRCLCHTARWSSSATLHIVWSRCK